MELYRCRATLPGIWLDKNFHSLAPQEFPCRLEKDNSIETLAEGPPRRICYSKDRQKGFGSVTGFSGTPLPTWSRITIPKF